MIAKLLDDLQNAITGSDTLTDKDRAEFLKHVEAMKTSASAEPPAPASDDGLHPIDDLVKSVEGLEASHPDITSLVNRIAMTLSNMGL